MEAENTVKALAGSAVITAIPVVAFALWADYFGHEVGQLKKEDPDFDRDAQAVKVKIVSLFGLFFQLVIYLAFHDVRAHHPVVSNLIFFAAILLHLRIQASAEALAVPPKQLKSEDLRPKNPADPSARATLGVAFRAFYWSLLGGVLYVGVLVLCMRAAYFMSQLLKVSPAWSLAFLVAGSAAGVLGGLGLGFALGPFQLRKMFPATRLVDPELLKDISDCFARAQLKAPEAWIIDLHQPNQAGNALIAGFNRGRGIFRPGIFLTQATVTTLKREELRAILLHEISHVRLAHLRKRFVLSSGMILGTSVLAGFVVILSHLLAPGATFHFLVGAGTVLMSLSYTFQLLAKQSRYQEVEADICAVRAGARTEELVSALRKLDKLNGVPSDRRMTDPAFGGSGHPSTEERASIVKKYFELHPEQLPAEARAGAASEESEKKAA